MFTNRAQVVESLRCRIGIHAFEVEYVSAPGIFSVGGKEVVIQGTVERCSRPGCGRLFFTYEDWPRTECHERSEPRRYSDSGREGRALILA